MRITPTINRQRVREDDTCAVRLEISHNGRARRALDFSVKASMWDGGRGRVKASHPSHVPLNHRIKEAVERLEDLCHSNPTWSADQVNQAFERPEGSSNLIEAIKAAEKNHAGWEDVTRASYRLAIANAEKAIPKATLENFSRSDVQKLRGYLQGLGLAQNTVRLRLSRIRTLINMVREQDQPTPAFRKQVPSPLEAPIKWLPPEEIEQIRTGAMPLPSVELARDAWILELCFGGMRVKDVLSLKPAQIEDRMLVYRQSKTKPIRRLPIIKPAWDIVVKYRGGKYVLPILEGRSISGATSFLNRNLKVVALSVGINKPLSNHWSRHSVTNWMLYLGIDLAVISMILGHKTIAQTVPYVARFDDKRVAEAMEKLEKAMG